MLNNIKLNGINIVRVLDKFLNEPGKVFTYNDFKDLRIYTGESRILGALRDLVKLGILTVDNGVGRPHIERGKRKCY